MTPDQFLADLYESHVRRKPGKPVLTVTYAQSIDGKIAGKSALQLRLSGDQSLLMTHRLRQINDAIMVGAGTVLNDNPQLLARRPTLLPTPEQPLPFVLDTRLNTPLNCRLAQNFHSGISKKPVILSAENKESDSFTIEACDTRDVSQILSHVAAHKCSTLMVEGGAKVIAHFLAPENIGLVDLVIITIAPVFVGEGVAVELPSYTHLEYISSIVLGPDIVVAYKPVAP